MSNFLDVNRRQFLRLGLQSGLTYLSFNPLAKAGILAAGATGGNVSEFPLRPFSGSFTNIDYNGDNFQRAHERLFNLEAFIAARGGRPAPSESREIVIAGGGISGLSSAYFLANRNPLLLEQDMQFGGNSKGEIYGNLPFSIGGAYIAKPDAGSPFLEMLQRTGVLSGSRIEEPADSKSFKKGLGFKNMWAGELDPANTAIYQRVKKDFLAILTRSYPQVPWIPGSLARPALDQLDRISFYAWLQQRYGNTLPPTLIEYFQLYCWSSLGGSITEISAAQALNFLTADTNGVVTFPGGNSAIAQGLYNYLQVRLGPQSMRSGHFILEIKANAAGDGVNVLVETPRGTLQTIACRACIVALPKHVAQFIVPGMSDDQKKCAGFMKYRGFIIANALLKTPMPSPTFDAYLQDGTIPPTPSYSNPPNRAFADMAFANWASHDQGARSIITLYKPFPYDGAEHVMINPSTFARVRDEAQQTINQILGAMGVAPSSMIDGIRLTRWGHALPLAQVGFLASHSDLIFQQPTSGRIFYANQDNAANPAIESAFTSAQIAAAQVLRN